MTLQQVFNEGRLIRGDWHKTDEQGRQLLCLYTALAGDPNARPSTCPASLAPKWLAELLPWLDDSGSDEAWPQLTKRIVALAPKFANMAGATSKRLETEVRLIVLKEAALHTDDAGSLGAINCVMVLLVRRSLGDEPSEGEWFSAHAAAHAAARAAYSAAYSAAHAAANAAARAAARAAYSAARSAANAAAHASYAAANAAANAADAAAHASYAAANAAANAAAYSAAHAAANAAADRMHSAILAALEAAL